MNKQDVAELNDVITRYGKVCKKIGETDNRTTICHSELVVHRTKDLEIRTEELHHYRALLEHQKAEAEDSIYKAFEHVYG